MFLRGKPVIHMIDMKKNFCVASFLKSQKSSEIWSEIQTLRTLVYVGHPG